MGEWSGTRAGRTWGWVALLPMLAAAQPSPEPYEDSIALSDDAAETVPQAPDAAVATPVETLVVYGEKLGRTLTETASSVGIATREDLAAGTAADLRAVATQFGNVVAAGGDREIAIRGIPLTGIGGEGETISVYLDGVALPPQAARFAGPLSAWDLEQIEVLRGAQSTNQGRNSLAGSVVLQSRDPTAYWDARLRAGVMSRDGHDYAVAGGGPLSDSLRFRVSAQDRYDNGDIVNVTRQEDDAGREDTRNARASLLWTPAALPGYRARYGVAYADNEFGDPLHDSSAGPRTQSADVRGSENDITTLHSLQQRLPLGGAWRAEAVTGWVQIENLYTIDYDRSASDGGYSDNTLDERIFSQELRAHYDGARLRAVVGAYYADSDKQTATIGHDVAAAGGLVLLNGTIDSDSNVRTRALFAEADWDLTPHWRLTAGLRYNEERARRQDVSELDLTLTGAVPGLPLDLPIGIPLPDLVSDALALAAPGLVPPDYEAQGRDRYTDPLPKLGLSWLPSDDTTLALTYQEGYRSGGTSVSFFGGNVSPYAPEYTRTVELAYRGRWWDRQLRLNANVFYTDWRDQQVTIGETSGFETVTENAGRSHLYGLEAEALWAFDAPIDLFFSGGLLRTAFDEFVNDGEDYANNRFPYAPEYTVGAGLSLRAWRRFSGQLTVQRIGSLFSDPDNDPRSEAPARTLVNARVDYRLPAGFSVAVYGRNLTDELNLQGALVAGERLASRYGEPRSAGVLLEWQY